MNNIKPSLTALAYWGMLFEHRSIWQLCKAIIRFCKRLRAKWKNREINKDEKLMIKIFHLRFENHFEMH